MATWQEVCVAAETAGGEQLTETACKLEVQGRGEDRTQMVYLFYEVIQPDFEMLRISSPFTKIDEINVEAVLRDFGRMAIGGLAYSPLWDDQEQEIPGFVTLSASIPLPFLDLTSSAMFAIYLNMFAQATDLLEQRVDAADRY